MSIARYVSRRPGPHLASFLDGTTEQSRPHGSTLYIWNIHGKFRAVYKRQVKLPGDDIV